MSRHDLFALVGVVLLIVASGAVDWRFGVAVAGVAALVAWWFLMPLEEG